MIAVIFTLLLGSAQASPSGAETLYNTRTHTFHTLEEAANFIPIGSVVVLGEEHITPENENDPAMIRHHENQARWIKSLKNHFSSVQVGLEFLAYPDQPAVDDFLSGKISRDDFLKKVAWGQNPFTPYEALMFSAHHTTALNIPRTISRVVAKGGPKALTPEHSKSLPPVWERGSDVYFERFRAVMGHHVTPEQLENYFWAQSLWDDTMAWRTSLARSPAGVFTVIVGEFHSLYGHGLPARLNRYGVHSVVTIAQRALQPNEQPTDAVQPDPKWGQAADWIWVYW